MKRRRTARTSLLAKRKGESAPTTTPHSDHFSFAAPIVLSCILAYRPPFNLVRLTAIRFLLREPSVSQVAEQTLPKIANSLACLQVFLLSRSCSPFCALSRPLSLSRVDEPNPCLGCGKENNNASQCRRGKDVRGGFEYEGARTRVRAREREKTRPRRGRLLSGMYRQRLLPPSRIAASLAACPGGILTRLVPETLASSPEKPGTRML